MVEPLGQFRFTPERYLDLMHEQVPRYDELQQRTAAATAGTRARRILELEWLDEAGFVGRVRWTHKDLAILVGELR